jgi:hypothetical protein
MRKAPAATFAKGFMYELVGSPVSDGWILPSQLQSALSFEKREWPINTHIDIYVV